MDREAGVGVSGGSRGGGGEWINRGWGEWIERGWGWG